MFSTLYRALEHNYFNSLMTMFTCTLHVWYAFLYCNQIFNATTIVIVSSMNCGNDFCIKSVWTCTLIIDLVKPIWDRLQPHGLICANEIRSDTSLSSSSDDVLTTGICLLRLIWSGVVNCGTFPF